MQHQTQIVNVHGAAVTAGHSPTLVLSRSAQVGKPVAHVVLFLDGSARVMFVWPNDDMAVVRWELCADALEWVHSNDLKVCVYPALT